MWPVTRYAFAEPLRNPWSCIGLSALVGTYVAAVIVAVVGSGGFNATEGFEVNQFLQMATGFLFPLGLILGFGLISNEVSNGTVQIALTRPIRRWHYLAGRLLGRMALVVVLFAVFVATVETLALAKGVPPSWARAVQWLGVLLIAESMVLLLGVLGTVASRFGSVVIYFMLILMFQQIGYFTSASSHVAAWRAVGKGADIARTLVMGLELRPILEAPLSPWHAGRMLGLWAGHATFLFSLGSLLFGVREVGTRE